ncbi:unnamed protein product [Discosporangium mesarthrocarpum]
MGNSSLVMVLYLVVLALFSMASAFVHPMPMGGSLAGVPTAREDRAASQYPTSRTTNSVLGMEGQGRMETQELIVDFTEDGRVMLEVKGVKEAKRACEERVMRPRGASKAFVLGEACRKLTEELIEKLGEVIYTENTEEFFEQEKVELKATESVKLGWSYDSSKPEW